VNGKEIVFDVDSDELDGLKDDVPGLCQITKLLEKAAYFAA
jgi:DNA primase catalytic subunit